MTGSTSQRFSRKTISGIDESRYAGMTGAARTLQMISFGFCAVCGQILFARELLGMFSGTEFSLGVVLAAWLFWIGAGSVLGGRIAGRGLLGSRRFLSSLASAAALLLPITVLAIRAGRGMLADPPGEMPQFLPSLIFSSLVIAPFGLVYGTIYNSASTIASIGKITMAGGVTRVYILEAAGALAGAVAFSSLVLGRMSQFSASWIIAAALAAVGISISGKKMIRNLIIAAAAAAATYPLAHAASSDVTSHIFPGFRIARSFSSRYGEIVVGEREGTLTWFSGGARLFSVPEPERAEETVHPAMLASNKAARVLLVGGSLGGACDEVLKYPGIKRLDCLELDGALMRSALELTGEAASEDPARAIRRSSIEPYFIEADGRAFIAAERNEYDVIAVTTPAPSNLQWNRYYTREFFASAKRALAPGGILAISHESSENYMTDDQVRVLKIIEKTLLDQFRYVTILPGGTAHFVASDRPVSADSMLARLSSSGLGNRYLSEGIFGARLSEERRKALYERLSDYGDVPVNTDLKPVLVLGELTLQADRQGTGTGAIFRTAERIPASRLLIAAAAAIILIAVLSGGKSAPRAAVFITGFAAMLFQMALLLGFQVMAGRLYFALIMITALFMAGSAAGAAAEMKGFPEGWITPRRLNGIFFLIVLSSLIAGLYLKELSRPAIVFYAYSAAGGFLTGMYYGSVVSRVSFEEGRNAPGEFYGWDIFGACLAALSGGILIIPVAGLPGAIIVALAAHASAGLFPASRI